MAMSNPRNNSNSRKPDEKGGPTLVFETDGRILYEVSVASLANRPLVIGRDKSCDWCTAGIDNSVSSRHAEIVRRRGAVWIRDLGSRNGLFFQGERVKEHRLVVGEPVLLGACKVTLEHPKGGKESSGAAFHRLEQRNGPESGRTLELKGDADLVIGSDPGCDIFVPDTLVSRQHAKLSFKKDGSCWVSDLGSRNGTSVDGMAVAKGKERLLRDGNVLSVAYVEFRFLDKDAVHVNARVGAKLLVAAATVAIGVIGYSVWNLMRADAGRILYRAESYTKAWTPDSTASDFVPAFALLDQAAVARGADKRAADHTEQRARMESWTNTIVGWQEVRSLLSSNQWVTARERFNALSAWTWPSPTAAPAHHEAESVQRLVAAFLDGRNHLRSEDWRPDEILSQFRRDADELKGALAGAPTPDSRDRRYIRNLRVEAEDLESEFRHAVEVVESIANVGRSLRLADSGKIPPDNAAESALRTIRDSLADEKEHERIRFDEKGEKKRKYPFFSPLVSQRLAAAIPPLEALASGECQVNSNVTAIASARWGDVRRSLEFPSRTITDASRDYQSYRDWLEAKNAQFCGTDDQPWSGVDTEYRSKLDKLSKKFGAFLSAPTNALQDLLDSDTLLNDAFQFVDPLTTPPPSGDVGEWVCEYDHFVGIKPFRAFLSALTAGKSASDAVDAYKTAAQKLPWTPVIVEVRGLLEELRRFVRCPDEKVMTHPNPKYSGPILEKPAQFVADAEPDDGPNHIAEALSNAQKFLDDFEEWRKDSLLAIAKEQKSDRVAILHTGIDWILRDQRKLRSIKFEEVSALAEKIKKLDGDIRKKDKSRMYIVTNGIPDTMAPYIGAWRHLNTHPEEFSKDE